MTGGVVSAKRREQARKHAVREHLCWCGKLCRGNGGWSSHKRACDIHKSVMAGLRSKR